MYINSGYRNHSLLNFKDKSRPLIVGSCGTYRLSTHPKLPTYRPRGRLDFQIIYVASGRAHFHFDNPDNDTIIDAGNMVLFRPREFQKYEYYGIDKTEVYWIHFTGSDVKNILRKYGFSDDQRVFPVGISLEYERIFKKIILELQRCQDDYEEMLTMLLRYLLIIFHRELTKEHVLKNEYLDHEMDIATSYFDENYNRDINIEEYAASKGMSVSWFIRNFKRYTGATPMQFITSIRITNAQMLLETTNYAVNEISRIVGYDNPLYFSRLFRKYKGCSPSKYRKRGE
ncbi:MAG: AraC family transcriptional regulator [Eubacterium sp.]|nr:AraC family transcriptional regulator [Eubacterium sp.]